MKQPEYIVSACLCGLATRYDGRAKPLSAEIRALLASGAALPVCPECDGGLSTPRPPAEICGNRVVNTAGVDVTDAYRRGAEHALALCRRHGIRKAILKQNSPSCGCRCVYDGTFSGRLVAGRGIAAALLEDNGITVFDEETWQEK